MAPNPQCTAIAAAMEKNGLNYAQLAAKANSNEQRIIDICTRGVPPTKTEFDNLTVALDINQPVPHDAAHQTA